MNQQEQRLRAECDRRPQEEHTRLKGDRLFGMTGDQTRGLTNEEFQALFNDMAKQLGATGNVDGGVPEANAIPVDENVDDEHWIAVIVQWMHHWLACNCVLGIALESLNLTKLLETDRSASNHGAYPIALWMVLLLQKQLSGCRHCLC